jgi:hypothetical protein
MQPQVERIYLRELVMQCRYALGSAAEMNNLLKAEMSEPFFRETHAFLAHAAAASRILWPPGNKAPRAKARAEELRSVLQIGDGHGLEKRALRNHLEHFDERLDQWAQDTLHGAFIDLCIGPVQTFLAGPAVSRGDFLRVFEPDRKVFTFRGEEFDIQGLVVGIEEVMRAADRRLTIVEAAVQQAVAADDPAAGKSG